MRTHGWVELVVLLLFVIPMTIYAIRSENDRIGRTSR